MKKIVLLMAYFGKLPTYFDLWLKSAERNNTIDFVIISDIKFEKTLPANVKKYDITFDSLKKKIQSKFPFKIQLSSYARLSQFRPAFGYIFPELIEKYDFWGYVECDLILGNLRYFLNDELLGKYDKFFKFGHLQIFRNCTEMNELFMSYSKSALDYKFAFSSNILFFEEIIGMYNICLSQHVKLYDERIFGDLQWKNYRFIRSNFMYPQFSLVPCLFYYNDGNLFIVSNENGNITTEPVIYCHLQKRIMKEDMNDFNHFLILPNSFVNYREITQYNFDELGFVSDEEEKQYYAKMNKRDSKARLKHIFSLSWLKYYVLKKRIVRHGGYDSNGKHL